MKTAAGLPQKYQRITGPLTWLIIGAALAVPLAQRSSRPDLAVQIVVAIQGLSLLGLLLAYVAAGALRKSFAFAVIAAVVGALAYGKLMGHS